MNILLRIVAHEIQKEVLLQRETKDLAVIHALLHCDVLEELFLLFLLLRVQVPEIALLLLAGR